MSRGAKQRRAARRGVNSMTKLRRVVRDALVRSLDDVLKGVTKAPNGDPVTVHDDLCMRAAAGLQLFVSVHVREPEQGEAEAKGAPGDAPEGLIHGPDCKDPDCAGTCMNRESSATASAAEHSGPQLVGP